MPGFVDVTNMTSLEVKRLAQADEDYTPPAEFDTDVVFAVSAQVWNQFGGYHKEAVYKEVDGEAKLLHPSNKTEVMARLKNGQGISKNDAKLGAEIRKFCKSKLMAMLSDNISDYDRKLLEYASQDKISANDKYAIAIIASTPSAYDRAEKKRKLDEEVAQGQQSYIGDVGDKVSGSAKVLKSNFSTNYGIYFVTAITDSSNIIFFAHKNNLATAAEFKFKGTVKAHREQFQTQLNRVKVTV